MVRETGVQFRSSHTKDSKNGTWCRHVGVVAIEKGAFGLPSTKVANFTYNLTCYTKHQAPMISCDKSSPQAFEEVL